MRLVFLGTGTSHGIPVIGCDCAVCDSVDTRDIRFRSSALVKGEGGEEILIDAGPEFRLAALREGIKRIDAVLVTHPHADHVHGLDDLRPLSKDAPIRLYGNRPTIDEIRERFAYVFRETQKGGGKPRFDLEIVGESFKIGNLTITPIPVRHGRLDILGWRVDEGHHSLAYVSDASAIEETSMEKLRGLDLLVLNALRKRSHETHFNFDGARTVIEKLAPARAYITHLCHEHSHAEIEELFADTQAPRIHPAWDGLSLTVP